MIAGPIFNNFSREGTFRAEAEMPGAGQDIGVGRKPRSVDQFSTRRSYEKRIGVLEFPAKLANRSVFVGRIEDDVALAGLGGDGAGVSFGVDVFGKFDGDDGVIEDRRWQC